MIDETRALVLAQAEACESSQVDTPDSRIRVRGKNVATLPNDEEMNPRLPTEEQAAMIQADPRTCGTTRLGQIRLADGAAGDR